MEYDTIYTHFANYVPPIWDERLPGYSFIKDGEQATCYFRDWLRSAGAEVSKEYTDFMMMTLPSPREKFYQSSDYL